MGKKCEQKIRMKTFTLPETNISPLKINGWKMNVILLGWPIFRVYVGFREGIPGNSAFVTFLGMVS